MTNKIRTMFGGTTTREAARVPEIMVSLLIAATIICGVYNPESTAAPSASEENAFQHLDEVMDKYHENLDVYTDVSCAGNHFVYYGRMSSTGDGDKIVLDTCSTVNPHSGFTCIENRFTSSGNNWGGWYFMNGVLEGEESQPKENWGDVCNAGLDLTGATELTFWARGAAGGERVEFFAFGVGVGVSGIPCPESSSKKTLNYKTLSTEWTKYTINLQGKDLTYVLGGFGLATSASRNGGKNITFYLDDIKYNKSRLEEPRFLVSYETATAGEPIDKVMKNVSFTYDNALTLIAYLSRGGTEDMQRAELLARALVYAVENDRTFDCPPPTPGDGCRLRNAFQGGDLVSFPGWNPNDKADTVRMPGWWECSEGIWKEDCFQISTHTGNLAWATIALLDYYEKAGGAEYLNTAIRLAEWIERETRDTRGAGGYTGGYEGWEADSSNPEGQTKVLWKSTEHNIDVYVAFTRLYRITKEEAWSERAQHAKDFVDAMWDKPEGHFWTGTECDGETINYFTIPLDVQAWALMARIDEDKYKKGIDWVESNCSVDADGFKGFSFSSHSTAHVWFEGTAHMVIAYEILDDTTNADTYLNELRKAQTTATNNNGKGIVATSYDGLSTGFVGGCEICEGGEGEWLLYNRLHIGTTAWYIFAERGYNPYWGTNVDACSHDGDVNGDCGITPNDALAAFHHYLEKITLDECSAGHANVFNSSEPVITPNDALCIFKNYLEKPENCLEGVNVTCDGHVCEACK